MDDEKYICHGCVGDESASILIRENGTNKNKCSYCGSRKKTIPLYDISDKIHNIINTHYRRRYDDGNPYRYDIGDSAEELISDLLEVYDEDISQDIYSLLQESYNSHWDGVNLYDDDIYYKRDYSLIHSLENKWEEVKLSLQCKARFFNKGVEKFFDEIFGDIHNHQMQDGNKAVISIDNNTPLYRARVFDSLDKVESALENPEKNFGPPPYMHATSGRMNATGIPVFYGALSPEIAIAEVRPAVGSYVVVAQFRPVRPLQILDISALDKITPYTKSLFDPVAAEKLAIASFLRKLSQKLTTPVSGQRTDHEYLITQAVSEYLSVSETYALDGIRFRSTQQSQETDNEIKDYNIVLFSKSATVFNADNPNLQYWVELMEDEYFEDECYSRLEPRIYEKIINKNSFMSQHENRPTIVHHLVLDTSCLTIHEIKGVIYQSTEYSVTLGRPINFGARGSSGIEETEEF